ncbi:MAG: UvrD-helicase domain-containing protein [Actinomycetota bacterium]|nr:UvrD-helicase domain-containing protein [Actinomycetota bacterium]
MTARLPDQAARDRITGALDETLFVEAGAGSGKTKSLVDRVVALVDAGSQMRAIATITFTEKAAAELRDRLRRAFEDKAGDPRLDGDTQARFDTALDQLDAAAVSTLHAFAQRILSENPLEAALPPNPDVLDEVASQIEFDDRWTRFRDALLDDPTLQRTLLLAFAADIRLDDLRQLAAAFDRNWDLVGAPQRVPWSPVEPPRVEVAEFGARLDALLARRGECLDPDDLLCVTLTEQIAPYLRRLRAAPDEFEVLRLLGEAKPTFRSPGGKRSNWHDKDSVVSELRALGDHRSSYAREVALACLQRIAVEVARFTTEAAAQRRTSGRLEFHDLLVLARELLRGPHGVAVRQRLRSRYQRLLLDEFQDTDPIQIDLAVLIASDDPDAADKPWDRIPVEAGRLFFVGDPKQSIYRFRRADIDLYLQARRVFGEPVALTTNFRTTPPVIRWVNGVFGRLIQYAAGSQPAYQALDAAPQRTAPPGGCAVCVLGREPHTDEPLADDLRDREANDVADAVLAASGWQVSQAPSNEAGKPGSGGDDGRERWRDARLGDIAILLPARTSLVTLERALNDRDIPYRAETSSLVYSTREVRDLMAVARAVADPTDQLALVTALRSPAFGCGDDDLYDYRVVHGGSWNFAAPSPEGLDEASVVAAAMRYLKALHHDRPWLTPSELLSRIARDRRLFELGYAEGRPRDLWRRLRFVLDQARAWSESEGGTLREYLDWARMQASESARVAETILPETDDDAVRILTIHGAKGLEFPITILSGMTTASTGRRTRVEVAFPAKGPVALKVSTALVTPEFEAFKPIDEQMDFHERLRLLYVACTRAKDHLIVSLHRKPPRKSVPESPKRTSAELIAGACEDLERLPTPTTAPGRPAVVPVPDGIPAPPPFEHWEAERSVKLAASTRRRSLGASDVALLTHGQDPDAETVAGGEKDARDLELPPWQKGRYGTAVGRAVHAVLQTVDLVTGAGLAQAAAAQAAAEGIIGREAAVARLAGAALSAPSVVESHGCRRWRETYVATTVGDRTLEGYIDLLYRTGEGLVVVDYKTASSTRDLDRRIAAYRAQGGAYAVAVEQATGERVCRVVFVFLTPDGAVELELPELEAAKADVRVAVATPM